MRKKRVLLGLVETMNFVDENNRAGAILPRALGVGHHLFDFLDARQHGRELDEVGLGHARDDLGELGLAGPRWPPENQGTWIIAFNLGAQGLAWPNQVL